MSEAKTRVIFRRFKRHYTLGEIIALFPDIPDHAGMIMSYMHVGQHGGADYTRVMGITKPATPEEYAALARELTSIGYKLDIRKKR
jgi:hypothetical protein